MSRLTASKQAQVIAALVEGNSIRATVRMTGAAKNTIVKLLAEIGTACEECQNRTLRILPCSWKIGTRGASSAYALMHDLADRVSSRIQLKTDGHRVYAEAVESAFGANIDYAMLVKIYGADRDIEATYSSAKCMECRSIPIIGLPKPQHISTNYVERQNLTMRVQMRRFIRLTNALSKLIGNLGYAVALHFMHSNFCRVHQTLRVTPAMEAGITDHVWTVSNTLQLIEKHNLKEVA